MFKIPNSLGQIRQTPRGDISGELWETFNIDLTTSQGKILTSETLGRVLSAAEINTPAAVNKILIWNSNYYLITEDDTFSCSINNDPTVSGNWTEVNAVGTNGIDPDAVIFDGQMRISLNTNIARFNGSASYATNWWTSDLSGTALTSDVPHQMAVVQSQKETLYVTDGSRVQYYEKGAASTQIVELDSNVTACCLAGGLSGAMWVGTFNETSGKAYVYEIYTNEQVDGTTVYRQAYPIDGRAVLAITLIDNVPHIVTDKGTIQAFNGAGFSTVAEFPFVFDRRKLDGVRPGLIQTSGFARPVHPNGIGTHADSLYILINTDSEDDSNTINVRSHSGVWEYNAMTKVLNHRYSLDGYARLSNTGALLVADNQYSFILAGATTDEVGLFGETSTSNISWFTTPEISSDAPQDVFDTLYHKVIKLSAGEQIDTLYRISKRDTVYVSGTWLSDSVFNTTGDFSGVLPGELVRVSVGNAAGSWAMITKIEQSASTYSITLDTAIGVAGETATIYSDNFKKIDATMTSSDDAYKQVAVNRTHPWVQFMVILDGDIEYRMFDLQNRAKHKR